MKVRAHPGEQGSVARPILAVLLLQSSLAACATGPSPEARLSQAQVLIEGVKAGEGWSQRAVGDAQGALDYARFEARSEGSQPLASHRADIALAKALEAQAACRQVGSRR
jgi:hypothetical protein